MVICDRSGMTFWASDCQKEWTGALVHKSFFEARHSQDFVRGVRDNMRVSDPRPDVAIANVSTVGPLITELTADASAGATSIQVTSTSGMSASDRLAIMLDSGDAHFGVIQSIGSSIAITLTAALAGAASSGNVVVDHTAITQPSLG